MVFFHPILTLSLKMSDEPEFFSSIIVLISAQKYHNSLRFWLFFTEIFWELIFFIKILWELFFFYKILNFRVWESLGK